MDAGLPKIHPQLAYQPITRNGKDAERLQHSCFANIHVALPKHYGKFLVLIAEDGMPVLYD